MITRLTATLLELGDGVVLLQLGSVVLEVQTPGSTLSQLRDRVGRDVTLHTLLSLDGNPGSSHFVPRIVGFATTLERDLFHELLRVKGFGPRKTLRAMEIPAPALAQAIERQDLATLSALPEIGKKSAAALVAELRGRLTALAAGGPVGPASAQPSSNLTPQQEIALNVLVAWGDRRADAERWIAAVIERQPELADQPDEIVRAVYRLKQGGT